MQRLCFSHNHQYQIIMKQFTITLTEEQLVAALWCLTITEEGKENPIRKAKRRAAELQCEGNEHNAAQHFRIPADAAAVKDMLFDALIEDHAEYALIDKIIAEARKKNFKVTVAPCEYRQNEISICVTKNGSQYSVISANRDELKKIYSEIALFLQQKA